MRNQPPHIVLIDNFAPDGQESMARFSSMLKAGFRKKGISFDTIAPEPRFAKLVKTYRFGGLPKWLGYVDKLILFPRRLRRLDRAAAGPGRTVFHIVDHSNAPYTRSIRRSKSLVTCHDLLAVRGALGDESVDCPATRSGRLLQKSILRGLESADRVACVSEFTRSDLLKLLGERMRERSEVILNGINHAYGPIGAGEARRRIASLGRRELESPYILHVGSNLKRKNKLAVVEALGSVKDAWPGFAVFCGPAIPDSLRERALSLGIADRIVNILKPDNDLLEALYSQAHAFVFPSTSEGFGWPVSEAQACGCPVICADRAAIPEVAGEGAIIVPPDDYAAIGKAILKLDDARPRDELIAKGFANSARFGAERMVEDYIGLYRRLLDQ